MERGWSRVDRRGWGQGVSGTLASRQRCWSRAAAVSGAALRSTDDISPLEIMGCKVVQHLIDEAVDAFDKAETAAEEADRRVLPLPRWRQKLWLLWQSVSRRL